MSNTKTKIAEILTIISESLFIFSDIGITISEFIPIKTLRFIFMLIFYICYLVCYALFAIAAIYDNVNDPQIKEKKDCIKQKISNILVSNIITFGILASICGIAAMIISPYLAFVALILLFCSEGLFFLSEASFLINTISYYYSSSKNKKKRYFGEIIVSSGMVWTGVCLTTIASLDLVAISLSTTAYVIINLVLPGIGSLLVASGLIYLLIVFIQARNMQKEDAVPSAVAPTVQIIPTEQIVEPSLNTQNLDSQLAQQFTMK